MKQVQAIEQQALVDDTPSSVVQLGFSVFNPNVKVNSIMTDKTQAGEAEKAEREVAKAVKAAEVAKAVKAAEVAKAVKSAEREAAKAAKLAEREAEKAEREVAKAVKAAEREAEKAEREAKKAEREAEKAEREVAKAVKAAEREAAKAARQAAREAARAERAAKLAELGGSPKMAALRTAKERYVKAKNGSLRSNDEIAQAFDDLGPDRTITTCMNLLGLTANPYAHLNIGQQSMNLRNKLRTAVKRGVISIDAIRAAVQS